MSTEIPSNVRLLIATRAVRSVGQGAMVAGFTLYLHALGWSGTAIGAVLTVALLFGTLLTVIVGPLSDHGGRRRFLLTYDALQGVAALVALVTTTPALLVTAAIVGAFGRGANGSAGAFSPVEQAWLAIELPMARRGRVFSLNSAVGFVGMAVGAAVAALVAWALGRDMAATDYRWLFLLPLCGSAASVALLWHATEPRLPKSESSDSPDDAVEHAVRHQENRYLVRLVLANALNGLGVGLTGPLIAYWFAIRFDRGLNVIGPGLAIAFFVGALGAVFAGQLAARCGVMRTIVWMRGLGVLLMVALPFAPWFGLAMVLYIGRGASNRGTSGVRQALAAGLTRARRRGLASSVQNVSMQLPRAIGPVIGGALFHAGYLTLPFLLGAALQLAYLVLYVVFFGRTDAARVRER